MVVLVSTLGIDRTQVPDGDGQLGIRRERAVVDGQREPLVPDAAILEVLVGGLRVHGERLGVGEGLDGDVEL